MPPPTAELLPRHEQKSYLYIRNVQIPIFEIFRDLRFASSATVQPLGMCLELAMCSEQSSTHLEVKQGYGAQYRVQPSSSAEAHKYSSQRPLTLARLDLTKQGTHADFSTISTRVTLTLPRSRWKKQAAIPVAKVTIRASIKKQKRAAEAPAQPAINAQRCSSSSSSIRSVILCVHRQRRRHALFEAPSGAPRR